MAKINLLHASQELPITIKEAWNFFSSPENLKIITPDHMGFNITSQYPTKEMYQGMIISYIVKPLFNIGISWVTEITHVNAPHYFVDEQRFGPYKFWHHQHKFTETEKGVLIEDILHYALPMGALGTLLIGRIVDKQLSTIFNYRKDKLKELFPSQ
jgi:ligand-binding SRPBCC domain-containing protein